jgi:hypothetical protein
VRDSSVSRKTSFKAVQQLKNLLYLESAIMVCYIYGNLAVVIAKCSYDSEDPINRFILSRTHYLLAT